MFCSSSKILSKICGSQKVSSYNVWTNSSACFCHNSRPLYLLFFSDWFNKISWNNELFALKGEKVKESTGSWKQLFKHHPLLIPAQESTVRPDNELMKKCNPAQELTVTRNGRFHSSFLYPHSCVCHSSDPFMNCFNSRSQHTQTSWKQQFFCEVSESQELMEKSSKRHHQWKWAAGTD